MAACASESLISKVCLLFQATHTGVKLLTVPLEEGA
jgi:hypothetical protein